LAEVWQVIRFVNIRLLAKLAPESSWIIIFCVKSHFRNLNEIFVTSSSLTVINVQFLPRGCATMRQPSFLLMDCMMTVKTLSLKMRRDWHYYAVAIGLIFILNGVIGLLGFKTQGWQSYAVGLVTWVICFWLAGLVIRRRPEEEPGTAQE
jgi:hypothetical protein